MDWPKCEECKGSGKGDYEDVAKSWWRDDLPCPACNGTGERDLTADEAAEYLISPKNYFIYWEVDYRPDDQIHDEQSERLIITFYFVYKARDGFERGKDFTVNVNGKSITEALNAACRAIKNKEEEPPCK